MGSKKETVIGMYSYCEDPKVDASDKRLIQEPITGRKGDLERTYEIVKLHSHAHLFWGTASCGATVTLFESN
jgi:uncharacterized protein YabE (DUF348 family)